MYSMKQNLKSTLTSISNFSNSKNNVLVVLCLSENVFKQDLI